MKRMVLLIALAACAATAQDRLTRIGGLMERTREPSQEAVVKALSVEHPVKIKATAEQFEKHCLDRATLDADKGASYVVGPDGFTRRAGSGNVYVRVMQRIAPGFFLASAGERFIAIRSEGDALMDDTEYSLPLMETGETYSYTTVLGAGKRVAVYARRPMVTADQIMARFKAGEAFLLPLKKTTTTPCMVCDGGGFVTVKQNPGGDRRTLCPACKGMRHVTLTCELIHSVTIATTNATPRVAVATPPQ